MIPVQCQNLPKLMTIPYMVEKCAICETRLKNFGSMTFSPPLATFVFFMAPLVARAEVFSPLRRLRWAPAASASALLLGPFPQRVERTLRLRRPIRWAIDELLEQTTAHVHGSVDCKILKH
jgi:hypothetical protein